MFEYLFLFIVPCISFSLFCQLLLLCPPQGLCYYSGRRRSLTTLARTTTFLICKITLWIGNSNFFSLSHSPVCLNWPSKAEFIIANVNILPPKNTTLFCIHKNHIPLHLVCSHDWWVGQGQKKSRQCHLLHILRKVRCGPHLMLGQERTFWRVHKCIHSQPVLWQPQFQIRNLL